MAGESEEVGIRFSRSFSATEARVDSAVTSATLNSSLFKADARCSTAFFPLSAEGEGAALAGLGVRVRLVALPRL